MIRFLFFFTDGEERFTSLDDCFFPLALMYGRFLNEKYQGKKIKFFNLEFNTEKTYQLFPKAKKHHTHSYRMHLNHDTVFDLPYFQSMSYEEQKEYLWHRAYELVAIVAFDTNNEPLLEASRYAYKKGLENKLNPDYKMLEKEVVLHGQSLTAALWVNFDKKNMYSNFTLEREGETIFKQYVDGTPLGVEFFLEMYKKIETKGNTVIIKGHYEVPYLPLKIPINEDVVKNTKMA